MTRLVLPPFSEEFSLAQLDALRDLTCYATGHLSYRHLFPANASDGLVRPSDQDITRFKDNGRLDFGGTRKKVHTVYQRVFDFLVEDFSRHHNLRHLFDRVYPQPNVSRLDEAAEFFYSYFRVNPLHMPEITKALRGVYFLYRFGERTREQAEYVKSVLGIWGRATGNLRWLEFRLAYKAGRQGEAGLRHHIRGVIVPVGQYFYFLGVDEGMTKAPTMMICLLPNVSSQVRKVTGTLLRVNTLYMISAARTASLRIQGDDTTAGTESLFARYETKADIHTQNDPEYENEFKAVLADIDNRVDGITKLTLRDD
jgi:hypothetical protein